MRARRLAGAAALAVALCLSGCDARVGGGGAKSTSPRRAGRVHPGPGQGGRPAGHPCGGRRPGLVDTELHATTGDADRVARMAAGIPLQRAAEPDEIPAAVEWLLGPNAGYVTATTLRVAGGR